MRYLGKAIEQAVNKEKQEVLKMLYDEIIKKETALAREWEFLSKQLPISGVRMDCASCDHKEICDEVVELKVSHFQNIK